MNRELLKRKGRLLLQPVGVQQIAHLEQPPDSHSLTSTRDEMTSKMKQEGDLRRASCPSYSPALSKLVSLSRSEITDRHQGLNPTP